MFLASAETKARKTLSGRTLPKTCLAQGETTKYSLSHIEGDLNASETSSVESSLKSSSPKATTMMVVGTSPRTESTSVGTNGSTSTSPELTTGTQGMVTVGSSSNRSTLSTSTFFLSEKEGSFLISKNNTLYFLTDHVLRSDSTLLVGCKTKTNRVKTFIIQVIVLILVNLIVNIIVNMMH